MVALDPAGGLRSVGPVQDIGRRTQRHGDNRAALPAPAPGLRGLSKLWLVLAFMAVFVGGAIGSLLRELLTPLLPAPWLWTPTLLINVAACFVIGWLYEIRDRLHEHVVHLAAVGFCGGLSTFSHVIEEIDGLVDAGRWSELVAMPVIAIGLGVAAAVLGELAARRVHNRGAVLDGPA